MYYIKDCTGRIIGKKAGYATEWGAQRDFNSPQIQAELNNTFIQYGSFHNAKVIGTIGDMNHGVVPGTNLFKQP